MRDVKAAVMVGAEDAGEPGLLEAEEEEEEVEERDSRGESLGGDGRRSD